MASRYETKDIKNKFNCVSRLGYEITGKRGGKSQIKDDIGRVGAFIDNSMGCERNGDTIFVDAFNGYGDTYKRREKCNITIQKAGKEVFNGTFDELVEKLSPSMKTYQIEPIEN